MKNFYDFKLGFCAGVITGSIITVVLFFLTLKEPKPQPVTPKTETKNDLSIVSANLDTIKLFLMEDLPCVKPKK